MAGGVSYVGARPYRPGMPESIVYLAQERPDVEVLWEGVWCPGEMRMQRQDKRRPVCPHAGHGPCR